MQLSKAKQNTQRIEQGAWVTDIPEADDLRIKTRGANNADWRELQTKLINALPAKKRRRGIIPAADMDKIQNQCLIDTCLLDWDNLYDQVFDDTGNVVMETVEKDGKQVQQPKLVRIPYSKEKALELIEDPNYRPFRDFISFAAQAVGEEDEAENKEIEGNSASVSATT